MRSTTKGGMWVAADDIGEYVQELTYTESRRRKPTPYTIHVSDIIDGRALVTLQKEI